MIRRLSWILAGVLGCTGSIGEGGPGGDQEHPPGNLDPNEPIVYVPPPGCDTGASPGHVVVHRLNRLEYNNTIRDLLGDSSRPADEFTPDDGAGGFDNNSVALTVNSQTFAQYEGAALRLAHKHLPKIVSCSPSGDGAAAACAKQALESFARRAWRRPVTADESADLAGIVQEAQNAGSDLTKAMEMAVQAVLLSPNFLYRVEYPPDPPSLDRTAPYPLDAHALASRLSYFIWSSMPDPELFESARSGELLKPEVLRSQMGRMLADDKAAVFADNLAGQWLMGRAAANAAPSLTKFATFDRSLRESIPKETALFLDAIIRENLDLRTLLESNFTFLNERLARHYRIDGIKGAAFQRYLMHGSDQRVGVLTQASFLIATSHADEPSIPRRGVTALASLLCTIPAAPPPNANDVQKDLEKGLPANPTRRQKAQARDAAAGCGACHAAFDPVGLALDGYDAVGAIRTRDEEDTLKRNIDVRGEWLGQPFSGPRQISQLIKNDERLAGCMTSVLFRYALGRVNAAGDQCLINGITGHALDDGFRAQDLLSALVMSPAFRFQAQ